MNITGVTTDMIATSALQQASASTEAVEQAESTGLLNTKTEIENNQKLQLKLDTELIETQKTARKKKRLLRFGKNRKIKKAQRKEAKLEADLKKTKGAHDKLLNSADAAISRIEKGNNTSEQFQKVMNQFQNAPTGGEW